MTIYDKARDLALEILDSNEAKKFLEVKYILDGDLESQEKLSKFTHLKQKLKTNLTHEILEKTKKELNDVTQDIKNDELIKNYTLAEKEFSSFLNSVMDIFNATLFGEFKDEESIKGGGCCGGGCSGCSGC